MQSKSTSCAVASLLIAFAVMLFVAAGAHGLLAGGEAEKSFAVPGTELSGITVAVWGLVAGTGAAVRTGATHLLTHLQR